MKSCGIVWPRDVLLREEKSGVCTNFVDTYVVRNWYKPCRERREMKNKEAAEILKGIEEVRGVLPEDGLQVEIALQKAINLLEDTDDTKEERTERCENCVFYDKRKRNCPIAGERVSFMGHCSEWRKG